MKIRNNEENLFILYKFRASWKFNYVNFFKPTIATMVESFCKLFSTAVVIYDFAKQFSSLTNNNSYILINLHVLRKQDIDVLMSQFASLFSARQCFVILMVSLGQFWVVNTHLWQKRGVGCKIITFQHKLCTMLVKRSKCDLFVLFSYY